MVSSDCEQSSSSSVTLGLSSKQPPKSYPVSDIYKDHIGEKCSELPNNLQNAIWDYQLAVQGIRGWTDEEIRSMFRRLNYVNERLTAQEPTLAIFWRVQLDR